MIDNRASPAATADVGITFDSAQVPALLDGTNDFSFVFWMWTDELPGTASFYGILSTGLQFLRHANTTGSLFWRLTHSAGTNQQISVAFSDPVETNQWPQSQWCLVVATYNASTRAYTLTAQSEGISKVTASSTLAAQMDAWTFIRLLSQGANRGWQGLINTALVDFVVSGAQFDALWAQRSPTAVRNLHSANIVWAQGYSQSVSPDGSGAVAVIEGDAVTADNLITIQTEIDPSLFTVYDYTLDANFAGHHRSPWRGGPWSSGLTLRKSGDGPAADSIVVGSAPILRRLATNSPLNSGDPDIIGSSANSRNVWSGDTGGRQFNASYIMGHLAERLASAAGAGFNRYRTASLRFPFFDLHTNGVFRASGTIDPINGDVSGNPWRIVQRFWYGGGTLNTMVAPGGGIRLSSAGAKVSIKARPEAGAKYNSITQAQKIRLIVLAHPGGPSSVNYTPEKSSTQNVEGTLGTPVNENHRTATKASRILTGDDTIGQQLIIDDSSVITNACAIGDFVYHEETGQLNRITQLQTAVDDNEASVIDLEFPWQTDPSIGDTLLFGEVRYDVVEDIYAGLDISDTEIYRGLEVENVSGDPLLILGYSAWGHDIGGFVFIEGGWGGVGYDPQIDSMSVTTINRYITTHGITAWLVFAAQQGSTASDIEAFSDLIRNSDDSPEIAWIGEPPIASDWDTYMIANAAAYGVPAVSLREADGFGDLNEMLADYMLYNTAHWSSSGSARIAAKALSLLDLATASGGTPGNFDGSAYWNYNLSGGL